MLNIFNKQQSPQNFLSNFWPLLFKEIFKITFECYYRSVFLWFRHNANIQK